MTVGVMSYDRFMMVYGYGTSNTLRTHLPGKRECSEAILTVATDGVM